MSNDDGRAGKEEGMERAARCANPHWWVCMLECGKEVARRKPFLFTDDVVNLCRERHPNVFTHEHRAIGPLMRELARSRVIEPTQDWVESSQKQCHRRPMRVWYSLIYKGPRRQRPRRRTINDPRQFTMFE